MPERYGVSAKGLLQTSGASPGWQIRLWGNLGALQRTEPCDRYAGPPARFFPLAVLYNQTQKHLCISNHFLGHLLVLLNCKGSFGFVYDLSYGIASWASREFRTTILSAWHAFLMPKQESSGCAHELNLGIFYAMKPVNMVLSMCGPECASRNRVFGNQRRIMFFSRSCLKTSARRGCMTLRHRLPYLLLRQIQIFHHLKCRSIALRWGSRLLQKTAELLRRRRVTGARSSIRWNLDRTIQHDCISFDVVKTLASVGTRRLISCFATAQLIRAQYASPHRLAVADVVAYDSSYTTQVLRAEGGAGGGGRAGSAVSGRRRMAGRGAAGGRLSNSAPGRDQPQGLGPAAARRPAARHARQVMARSRSSQLICPVPYHHMLRSAGESTIRSKKAGLQWISTLHERRTALQTSTPRTPSESATLQQRNAQHPRGSPQCRRARRAGCPQLAVIVNLQLLLAARRQVCDVELHCRPQGEPTGVHPGSACATGTAAARAQPSQSHPGCWVRAQMN